MQSRAPESNNIVGHVQVSLFFQELIHRAAQGIIHVDHVWERIGKRFMAVPKKWDAVNKRARERERVSSKIL